MTKREKHNKIASIILKNGEHYPKKHGEWICYKLINNISVTMDSWNKSICVMRNAKYDNQWTGFSGERIKYLGIDFGGYDSYVEEKILDNILRQCDKNRI